MIWDILTQHVSHTCHPPVQTNSQRFEVVYESISRQVTFGSRTWGSETKGTLVILFLYRSQNVRTQVPMKIRMQHMMELMQPRETLLTRARCAATTQVVVIKSVMAGIKNADIAAVTKTGETDPDETAVAVLQNHIKKANQVCPAKQLSQCMENFAFCTSQCTAILYDILQSAQIEILTISPFKLQTEMEGNDTILST